MRNYLQIDEAYIGGSETNKYAHKKGKSEKTVVIGMVNRNTKTASFLGKVQGRLTYKELIA